MLIAGRILYHWAGIALQRLFSTFPDRWPGVGLLLIRLGMGIALIYVGASPAPVAVAQNVLQAAAGLFLLIGLWTPAVGALAALDQIWIAFSDAAPIHILFAVLSAGVAMLGPGVWSIDARLFGRRRFPSHRTKA